MYMYIGYRQGKEVEGEIVVVRRRKRICVHVYVHVHVHVCSVRVDTNIHVHVHIPVKRGKRKERGVRRKEETKYNTGTCIPYTCMSHEWS